MNNKLCFLHLSDIHFKKYSQKYADNDNDLRNELLQDIQNYAIKEFGNITGVLVCGDIAYSGKKHEYDIALIFLNKICESIHLKESRIHCVPGNHDVDQEVCKNDPVLSDIQETIVSKVSYDEINDTISKFLSSPSGSGQILFNHLNDYNTFFAGKYGCNIDADNPYWTHQFELNDNYFLNIRGMNSVITSSHNDCKDDRKMIIGEYQVPMREKNIINMILCHHPPECWKDPEDKLANFINHRVHMQLYGHKHIQTVFQGGNTLIVGSGAAQPSRFEDEWMPYYNWMSIEVISLNENNNEKEFIEFKLYPRIYNTVNNKFEADTENCLVNKNYKAYRIGITDDLMGGYMMTEGNPNKEFAISLDNDDIVSDKDLIYHFMGLSFLMRSRLLDKFNLISEEDEGKKHIDILYKILNEIKAKDCKQNFWDDIIQMENRRD